MKKQLNEIERMQQLAGILKEENSIAIPDDVKKTYELWNDPNFPPGKLYGFTNSGLRDPKEILNNFAYELQDEKLIRIMSGGHAYVDALKWLDNNL